MVRRIKPISRARKAEKEVRKSRHAGPGRRPALPDPVELVQPAVDVYEKPGELVIEMELAGVAEEDIAILLFPSRVEVKGVKRECPLDREVRYLRLERELGAFRRDVVLPCAVDPDRTTAALENGVLTILLKKPRPRVKEVEIKNRRPGDT
jgi:HSP20 family molecular chaperone IbpA